MKTFWTPWRLEYVKNPEKQKSDGVCVFCKLAAAEKDHESLVMVKDADLYVVLNRYPYSNGHLMIIPCAHHGTLGKLATGVVEKMMTWARIVTDVLTKELSAQGFNIGLNIGDAAGAGIAPHLHMHIVPRWSGDTNFMPVIAEVKCIPDHLHSAYDKLSGPLERALLGRA